MRTARLVTIVANLLGLALLTPVALAHCQIPCGIYDDPLRFTMMREHVTTIEKSMKQVESLGGAGTKNLNQVVRWVENKEHHADELTHLVTHYFMSQRVKPPASDADKSSKEKYATQLALLHRIMVRAMKAKQTTDLEHVKALNTLIDDFEKAYKK